MYPHERSLVQRMQGKPFNLVGINSDPKEHIAKRMIEEKITWPFFWDGGNTSGPIATKWNVSGWPTIYVLDSKGVIRYRDVRGEEMDKAVDTLLKEMGVAVEPTTKPSEGSAKSD